MDLEISVSGRDGGVVLEICGECDISTAQVLRDRLLLQLTGLGRYLAMFPATEAALAAIQGGGDPRPGPGTRAGTLPALHGSARETVRVGARRSSARNCDMAGGRYPVTVPGPLGTGVRSAQDLALPSRPRA